MAFRLEYDAKNQILLIVQEGEITDQSIMECSETVRAAKLSAPICLIDMRGVTSYSVSTKLIGQLARRSPPKGSELSMQVTVAPQDLLFGLSRMFAIIGDENWPEAHVVRTMDEALALIGVESPSFSPLRLDVQETEIDH